MYQGGPRFTGVEVGTENGEVLSGLSKGALDPTPLISKGDPAAIVDLHPLIREGRK